MSDDHAAVAALAIERYVAGLRKELAVLGGAESQELIYEIRDMLVDAARQDPARAFAEMERLGEPWRLAADLLAERGITAEGGIPSASWWRMGVAATIDILVALALPVAVIVNVYNSVWESLFGSHAAETGVATLVTLLGGVCVMLGLSAWVAWRTWSPWRTGGLRATPGMVIAGVSVIRLGGTRSVVQNSDLTAEGMRVPSRTMFSAVTTVALAVLVVSWSLWAVTTGALDPSGQGAVYRFVGPVSSQEYQVHQAFTQLFDAALTPAGETRDWPPISQDRFDVAAFRAALVKRFSVSANSDSGGRGYEGLSFSNVAAGVWTVAVTEAGQSGGGRQVVLTYTLRVDWAPSGDPVPAWVLSSYEPAP